MSNTMWLNQVEWIHQHSKTLNSKDDRLNNSQNQIKYPWILLDQLYISTYMYHYSNVDILLGKPWDLNEYQGLKETRTLYIGGSVSFETIEDIIDYNLQLVSQKFDNLNLFETFTKF